MKKNIIMCFCLVNQIVMAPPLEFDPIEPTEFQKEKARKEKSAQRLQEQADREAIDRQNEIKQRQNSIEAERQRVAADRSKSKKPTIGMQPAKDQPAGVHIELAPHIPDSRIGGRSAFEEALKNGDLEKARQLWSQSRDSSVTTEEFVAGLKTRYSSPAALAELYPGKSYDQARDAFAKDLLTISPHVSNVLSDSFIVEKKSTLRPQARTDKVYFDWLEQNPMRLLTSDKAHDETPLETAIRENSPEMGAKIIEIAKNYSAKNPLLKITPLQLLDPIINEYKKIKTSKGDQAAFDYALKTYQVVGDKLAFMFHEHISKIS